MNLPKGTSGPTGHIKRLFFPLKTFPADFVEWVVAFLPGHLGPYAAIKRFLLNSAGAKIGHQAHIYPGVRILSPKGFVAGNNTVISSGVVISTAGTVTLGDRVLIGYGSKILSANHKIPENLETIFGAGHDRKAVVIEKDAWIGANVVVLPGVHIGEGAVVAAGAVVTKNVESFTIVGGVPAKVIRKRN